MPTGSNKITLADLAIGEAKEIINTCINCGCCNAICPTFDILADERDSPRGRINLIKDMLKKGCEPDRELVSHIDKCLSCNACLTACPSNVDYMHLIDRARDYVEANHSRSFFDRMARQLLKQVLPYPSRFRLAMRLARPFRSLAAPVGAIPGLKAYGALLAAVPKKRQQGSHEMDAGTFAAKADRKKRVLIPSGCVQGVLEPEINRSAVRLLTEVGVEVTIPGSDNCCGALVLHLGERATAIEQARRNIDSWYPLVAERLDAIVITASGCGTTIKDYGHMLAHDSDYAERAARVSELARDISEFLIECDLPAPVLKPRLKVACHLACSLQHAQNIMYQPRRLLLKAGFKLARPKDEHLCCGSAGTYSILQPDLSRQLRDRKVESLEEIGADVIASGNIGCISHIGKTAQLPVLHTVQLLDWSYTGHKPEILPDKLVAVTTIAS
ncbi:MAG: glycolate oxidase subunit GlcF [Hyphomicrobiales bacterium]|nr:glycolate oxidase subunit GlcF [Hyphomicrobiales bacterium]